MSIRRATDAQDAPCIVEYGGRFFGMSSDELYVLRALDGTRTPEEVRRHLASRQGLLVSTREIERFVARLGELGLLEGGEAPAKRDTGLRWSVGLSEAQTYRLCTSALWLVRPATTWAMAVLVVAAVAAVCTQRSTVWNALATGFGFEVLVGIVILGIPTAALHEILHGAALIVQGERPGRLGIGLVGPVTPVMFIDVGRAWALDQVWKRVWVWGAGLMCDLTLAAIGVLWCAAWGTWGHGLAWMIVLTTVWRVVTNVNPLWGGDGADLLSEACKTPAVMGKVAAWLRTLSGRWLVGRIASPTVTPRAVRVAFLATMLYQPIHFGWVSLLVWGVTNTIRSGRFLS